MALRLDRPLVVRALALLAGGAAIGLASNAVRPRGVALVGFEVPTSCSASAEGTAGPLPSPIVEVAPRDASCLCGKDGVVFADTRPLARFEEGHVAAAEHLPCDATEAGAQLVMRRLAGAETVIVYGDSSDDGRAVAETLRLRGLHADLRVLHGGFAAWETEGLACASGPSATRPIPQSSEARQ